MARRNSERKISRPEPATSSASSPGVVLLVWRKCPSCHWETRSIESPDADPLCPRCHSLMEREAVAPADSLQKKDVRATAGDMQKRAKPKK